MTELHTFIGRHRNRLKKNTVYLIQMYFLANTMDEANVDEKVI